MNQKTVKRILFAIMALAAFWWAAESYQEIGLRATTLFFGACGVWLGFSAATGAG